MDTQVTVGAIAAGLALGWIAHEHGFFGWVWRQLTTPRSWRIVPRNDGPDRACNRFDANWRDVALGKNRRWM